MTLYEIISIITNAIIALCGSIAFFIFKSQQKEKLRTAATVIVGQISEIENKVIQLKNAKLELALIYKMPTILGENYWEQHKHLFAKRLSMPEFQLVQDFFDKSELIERRRKELLDILMTAWKDKSIVKHEVFGQLMKEYSLPDVSDDKILELNKKLEKFDSLLSPTEIINLPNILFETMDKNIQSITLLTGTSAFQKLYKKSYNKK